MVLTVSLVRMPATPAWSDGAAHAHRDARHDDGDAFSRFEVEIVRETDQELTDRGVERTRRSSASAHGVGYGIIRGGAENGERARPRDPPTWPRTLALLQLRTRF